MSRNIAPWTVETTRSCGVRANLRSARAAITTEAAPSVVPCGGGLYPSPEGEAPEVTDLRRRKQAGEIAAGIDPAYLLIAMMGAVNTPVTMPQTIERICGLPAGSAAFRETYAEQLRVILRHLARPDGKRTTRTSNQR